jgi:hypothetical protein
MKFLLIVAALGAGVWFLMARAKQNAEVQKMANAPIQYTQALKEDEARAKAAADNVNKLLKTQAQQVQGVSQ